jgi:rhamnose transport system permease protein
VYRDKRTLISILLFIAVLCIGLLFRAREFFEVNNLLDIFLRTSYLAIASLGMMTVILLGHIDVSVGAILAACSTFAGKLAIAGLPIPMVALAAVIAGCILGALNGFLTAFLRIHSIVVTLGTLSVFRGLIILQTKGIWITDLPESLLFIGRGSIGPVPFPVIIAIIVLLFAIPFYSRTRIGRSLFAIGSNDSAANLAGLNVKWTIVFAFTLNGALVGLAGLLYSGRFGLIQPNTGIGLELTVITAVVVGGTNIFGGRGGPINTYLGALFVSAIGTVLIYYKVSPYWEQLVQGVFVILSVSYYVLATKVRSKGGVY